MAKKSTKPTKKKRKGKYHEKFNVNATFEQLLSAAVKTVKKKD